MSHPHTKAETARENGAKSRGPVTSQGKARAARNSLRHGLCARRLAVSIESNDELRTLREAYSAALQPQNIVEEHLVEEMVVAKWQQYRSWSLETAVLDHEMVIQAAGLEKTFEEIDEVTRLAVAFQHLADESRVLQLLLRYRNMQNRQYDRALAQLITLRSKAVFQKQPARNEPTAPPKQNTTNDPAPSVRDSRLPDTAPQTPRSAFHSPAGRVFTANQSS